MASLTRDLEGTPCAVSTCIDGADQIAAAAVTLPAMTGVPDDEAELVLDVPLCAEHAHLLRMGVDRFLLTT